MSLMPHYNQPEKLKTPRVPPTIPAPPSNRDAQGNLPAHLDILDYDRDTASRMIIMRQKGRMVLRHDKQRGRLSPEKAAPFLKLFNTVVKKLGTKDAAVKYIGNNNAPDISLRNKGYLSSAEAERILAAWRKVTSPTFQPSKSSTVQ